MKLRDILPLLESAIPPSNYGYWVLDSGEIVPVKDHDDLATERGHESATDAIEQDGWVRVVHMTGDWIAVQYDPRSVTKLALRGLLRIIQAGRYTDEDGGGFKVDLCRGSRTFADARQLAEFVRSQVDAAR